jgi:hypothetical protein
MLPNKNRRCEISGFRRGVDWDFAVLQCYALHVDSFSPTFRCSLSAALFKGQAVQEFFLDLLTLQDGTDRFLRNVG